MTDFSKARINMIDGQIHPSGVVDNRILNSFASTPRELFVPERLKEVAYNDDNLDIGQGRYLLEPMVHAKMLQAVLPNDSDVVLDIGSASGYSSAILAPMVATVIALENNKRQRDKAAKLWQKLDICNIALVDGKLEDGVADQAPYSLIIINGAVSEVPKNILNQLDKGARLITIVKETGQSMGMVTIFLKDDTGNISSRELFSASSPFLKGFEEKTKFNF